MFRKVFMMILLSVLLFACQPNEEETTLPEKGSVDQKGITLFPKSEDGYVGDPMPLTDGETMNMFYLLDERGGTIGFHPFALFQTNDFLNWEDIGMVIPYVNSISSQDMALGTGSVIKDKEGLYHAFYTGHNSRGEMPYFEKIQHATSTDLINWTKHPEHGFFGGVNDFRDPYVYYDEASSEYWMLITTRDYAGGIIKRYTSTDLITWTDAGVFYRNPEGSYNMECPTLIYFEGYYYLSFSAQGSNNERIVHYRYTNDLSLGFTIPEQDYFDGWGFYAGRIEKFDGRLILSGWVATKTLDRDYGTYMWGGHLVNHELIQDENGLLYPKIIEEIDEALSHEVAYDASASNANISDGVYTFSSAKGYSYHLFEELLARPTKMTFSVNLDTSTNFGLTYNAYDSTFGTLNAFFDIEHNRIEFYTVEANKITQSSPEITIPFDFSGINTLHMKVITENSVVVIYINEQIALTTRAYDMADSSFGFFTLNSNVEIYDVKFFE